MKRCFFYLAVLIAVLPFATLFPTPAKADYTVWVVNSEIGTIGSEEEIALVRGAWLPVQTIGEEEDTPTFGMPYRPAPPVAVAVDDDEPATIDRSGVHPLGSPIRPIPSMDRNIEEDSTLGANRVEAGLGQEVALSGGTAGCSLASAAGNVSGDFGFLVIGLGLIAPLFRKK